MLINIQFLRFIAAMLVVLYHTSGQVSADASSIHGLFAVGEAIGFAGVDIFFVISGFIMAHTTLKQTGPGDGLNFAARRVARIFSGHWPFFALSLVIFYWARHSHFTESNLLASFFLWPQALNRTLLEITWTLSFELYFYLLFSLVVWIVPGKFRAGLCKVFVFSFLFLSLYRHFVADSYGEEHLYFMPFWSYFLFSPFVLEFFAGALLAYYLQKHPVGRSSIWLIAGISLFLVSGAVNSQVYDGAIEQGFHTVPRVLWFGSSAIMIVLGLVRLENTDRKAPVRFSILTGGASYAIYLSHILILVVAGQLGLNDFLGRLPFALTAIGYILLMALILAYSTWHYQVLEKPLHNRFKIWLLAGISRK